MSKRVFVSTLITFLVLFSVLLFYNLIYFQKIYPGISIANLPMSGKSRQETITELTRNITQRGVIYLSYNSRVFEVDLQTFDFYYDFEALSLEAYKVGRSGNIIKDFTTRILLPVNNINLRLIPKLNEDKLDEYFSIISQDITQKPIYPNVKIVNGEINIEKGTPGNEIDINEFKLRIFSALAQNPTPQVIIPTNIINPALTDEEAQYLKGRVEKLKGKNLSLIFNEEEFTLSDEKLFNFLFTGKNNLAGQKIIEEISTEFNRNPQNPVFIFQDDRVTEFSPAKEGITVDSIKLNDVLLQKISLLETSGETSFDIEIPAEVVSPEITTEEVNNLGIKELIGRGNSTFFGSISSRIHNIGLASSHFNGVLVAPDDVFSFNEVLGDVSSYTGYKQAYIIRDGRTVLGDGGGVCQVSTTLFRAILAAGLPIEERRAHSYRVSYYEQGSPPGLDATVFSPTTDLKFKNDTPSHILIQTIFNPGNSSLVFEIYGTKDGRVATISKPVVYGTTPPPEDLYQDDPILPSGVIKQIDYKAWGAKVSFSYEVTKNGEIVYQKDFLSNYRPWQAVYLRGTGPAN
jgi:vancomycin resistance protein YoaR